MESIPQMAGELVEHLGEFNEWEEAVNNLSQRIAGEVGTMVMRAMDDALFEQKGKGLIVVGRRKRTITTRFGSLQIERRLYRDAEGNHRFLLDEAMGLEPARTLTPSMRHLANLLASHVPYRVAASIIRCFITDGPSHATLHSEVGRTGEEKIADEEEKARSLFEDGELPDSKMKKTPRLFIEADSTTVALQRAKRKRAELKLGVAYEGLEPSSGKALRAVGKTVQAGFAATEEFWQAFSVSLASTYDLGGVGEVVLGGDGASWVRGGSKLFPVKRFQLCRFHLKRALRTALGPDHDKVRLAYKAACKGDHEGADGILAEAESAATDERKEQIAGTRRYLAANRGCLADWRTDEQREEGVRGLGAMEGNIDKLLANRFKKRGMSWSVRGGDSMAKVIQLRQNGELEGWVQGARQRQDQDTLIAPAVEKLKKRLKEDPAGWLDAHMPALDGPHSDRPWVLMLKEMARIENVA